MNEYYTIIIGFIGGLLGGILVNIISYKFVKWQEKREEPEIIKKKIVSILNQIITNWETESSKKLTEFKKIQNMFDIYSKQLAQTISLAPDNFSIDLINEIEEFCKRLTKFQDLAITHSTFEIFFIEGQEIINRAKEIKLKIKS